MRTDGCAAGSRWSGIEAFGFAFLLVGTLVYAQGTKVTPPIPPLPNPLTISAGIIADT